MPPSPRIVAGFGFFVVAGLLGLQDRQNPKTAPYERQGKYVRDAATCAECHDDEAAAIGKGAHAAVPRTRQLEACETCHGPGAAHTEENDADNITMPPLLGLTAQRKLCARCHADQIAEHGGPLADLALASKKCTDCHKVHEARADIPSAKERRSFAARTALVRNAEPRGMSECATCHASKKASIAGGTHATLLRVARIGAAGIEHWDAEQTCEACHGPGSLHVATKGVARLITRPDRASDGVASCRRCHGDVDPKSFHWTGAHRPLLGAPAGKSLTCTSCHSVHGTTDPTRATGGGAQQPDARVEPGDCRTCHAPAYDVLHGTIHASVGCTSCHAGGDRHAAHGGNRDLVVSMRGTTAAFQTSTCNACHGRGRNQCGFGLGDHAKAGVGCLSCHSPAAPADKRGMSRDAHAACKTCHADVSLSFRHANRHPIGEGEFDCASCHDPHDPIRHGTGSGRRMQDRCLKCHKEHRGPFVFPHHADKGDGCMACHYPHGSSNRKLLHNRRARETCLACHADLPSFHDQSTGSAFRNCLDCHVRIHGSNRNRFFFR